MVGDVISFVLQCGGEFFPFSLIRTMTDMVQEVDTWPQIQQKPCKAVSTSSLPVSPFNSSSSVSSCSLHSSSTGELPKPHRHTKFRKP